MAYLHSTLSTDVTALVSGDFSAATLLTIANQAVRTTISEIDLRSTIRKSALSPNLFDGIFQYTCPTDIKGDAIIDVQPQVKRNRLMNWEFVMPEEFDRFKEDGRYDREGEEIEPNSYSGRNLIAISNDDMVRKLLIAMPIDNSGFTIDPLTSVGDWTGFGDGENLTADSDDYIKGSASINWDIDATGGTTAGITNSSLSTFDLTDYLSTGSVFVWAYISDITNVTNFILRIGNDSSNYYSITVTTTNEGISFENGWNLLRFDMSSKSETGSVDDDACDYVALYMTKDASKTSETDYRFNNLIISKGIHYYTVYYSKYPWISNASVRLENTTATTDTLMVESDEYDMIVAKTAELMERYLRNDKRADIFRKEYEIKKSNYINKNPSQSMIMTSEYWTF